MENLYESISPYSQTQTRNQVAVVTGGSRGIGEGIVRRFVEEGAKVVFSGRSSEKGKALEVELSPNVAFYRADAASASDTESLLKFTVERFGRLDCLVNNAGVVGEGGPIAGTWTGEDKPLGRGGQPVDVANAALWLASNESSWVTGHALVVDGGLTAGRTWSQMLHRLDQLRERFRLASGEKSAAS
ncbi:MAG TPA: SDR family oxidoreductase [Chthoniobacterales bacterium]|nr:SDR family oxidoreductase [Chthoniobacterales bacterium]